MAPAEISIQIADGYDAPAARRPASWTARHPHVSAAIILGSLGTCVVLLKWAELHSSAQMRHRAAPPPFPADSPNLP